MSFGIGYATWVALRAKTTPPSTHMIITTVLYTSKHTVNQWVSAILIHLPGLWLLSGRRILVNITP